MNAFPHGARNRRASLNRSGNGTVLLVLDAAPPPQACSGTAWDSFRPASQEGAVRGFLFSELPQVRGGRTCPGQGTKAPRHRTAGCPDGFIYPPPPLPREAGQLSPPAPACLQPPLPSMAANCGLHLFQAGLCDPAQVSSRYGPICSCEQLPDGWCPSLVKGSPPYAPSQFPRQDSNIKVDPPLCHPQPSYVGWKTGRHM